MRPVVTAAVAAAAVLYRLRCNGRRTWTSPSQSWDVQHRTGEHTFVSTAGVPFCSRSRSVVRPAAVPVFKLLEKYRPETKSQKVERLKSSAESKAAGAAADDAKRPRHIKYGLNHITYLVENQKAGLVVIASDVDPIEVSVYPAVACWMRPGHVL